MLTSKRNVILVVDDTRANLQMLIAILNEHGYQPRPAINGKVAMKVAKTALPDLILLDINMPDMSGYEVCQKLKQNEQTQDIPVIFISALSDINDKVKAFQMGGVDYITKPFQADEVLARVKTHLTLQQVKHDLQEKNAELQTEIVLRKALESALRESQVELQKLANLDGLTRISNRGRFDAYLKECWQEGLSKQQPLGLLMIDVDYFKPYNDNYGHLAGDDVLKRLAIILKQTIKRSQDLAARYGGEEFSIILPNTDIAGSLTVAKQIQHNINALQIPHHFSQTSMLLTLSIGIAALIPNPSLQPNDLIDLADKALYQAKQAGRNQIVTLSSE